MITVMGAGAFGTALAVSLTQRGPVRLWARGADHAADMQDSRENPRLPGVVLPTALSIFHVLETDPGDPVLLAVPMQTLRQVLSDHADHLHDRALVACCKGIELSTGKGPTAIIADTLPDATPAILTGPSFAADIARGLPTALTLACADPNTGEQLQQALNTPNLRIYRSTDTTGAELGGALKNVIAIGAGAAIGRGMGDSARAALMTRGFAEITRLATHMGAQPDTLMGLSGLGDLVLTCTSDQSRNYRFGLALGQGQPFDPEATVEGVATARAVAQLALDAGIDMPICATLSRLIDGQLGVDDAILSLLTRPLKEE